MALIFVFVNWNLEKKGKCSPKLNLFEQKYSKNSNIVEYFPILK